MVGVAQFARPGRVAISPGSPGGPGRAKGLVPSAPFFWAGAGVLALLADGFGFGPLAVSAFAILGAANSTAFVLFRQSRVIDAVSVFAFSTLIFVFLPALAFGVGYASPVLASNDVAAVSMWYFLQTVLLPIVSRSQCSSSAQGLRFSDSAASWAFRLGTCLASVGILVSMAGFGIGGIAGGAVFVGVVLVAIGTFLRAGPMRPFRLVLLAIFGVAYLEFIFGGFGRLRVGALGIAVLVVLSLRPTIKRAKWVLVASVAPVMTYLAQARVAFTAEQRGGSAAAQYTGFESVYGPFRGFSELIVLDQQGVVEHSGVRSFMATIALPVPRELWPDKPIGFGAELTLILRPHLAGAGHSHLALLSGEFLVGFGLWVGIVLMGGFLLFAIRGLARALESAVMASCGELQKIVLVAIGISAMCSIPDLIWGGTFTYMARVFPRVAVLAAVLLVVAGLARRASRPRTT